MRKFLIAVLLMAGAAPLASQAQKNKKNRKEKVEAPCELSCCEQAMKSGDSGGVDEAFMATATTRGFGGMHLEPEPFVLENQMGSMVMFNCADGMPGHAYKIPAKSSSNDYLIIIQEWWGLNDHIKKEAEKYYNALEGKVNVLAVDLYDGKVAATVDSAQKLIRAALSSKRKETILMGAMDFAGKSADIYTVGWCFGGMMSLQTAIMGGERVKGCIMYYGTPEKDESRIAQIKCDVLGIFGTQDRSIPNESVDAFANTMKSNGKNFSLIRYDAVHAFANPSNPGYNKEFGEDAFGKSIAFLKSHL